MRNNKSKGFCVVLWVFRALISIALLTYVTGIRRKDRKYPGSKWRDVKWFDEGYYTCIDDIRKQLFTKKQVKKVEKVPGIIPVYQQIQQQVNYYYQQPYPERYGGLIVVECWNRKAAVEFAKRLADNITGIYLKNPTSRLRPFLKLAWRNGELTYAFEALSHYDASLRIQATSWKRFVMSRYWYYTASFAIARATMHMRTIPGPRHIIYEWPADLFVPDVIFYLKYPAFHITDNMPLNMSLWRQHDIVDTGSRALKAVLRFVVPKVIDLYGDNFEGEIDPFEKAYEILRTRYHYLSFAGSEEIRDMRQQVFDSREQQLLLPPA